jgi:hypothetical protein
MNKDDGGWNELTVLGNPSVRQACLGGQSYFLILGQLHCVPVRSSNIILLDTRQHVFFFMLYPTALKHSFQLGSGMKQKDPSEKYLFSFLLIFSDQNVFLCSYEMATVQSS